MSGDEIAGIRVDLGHDTGPVHGGATGMLYGLGDTGIPTVGLLDGARPRTVAQKAPDGLQHPTGDAAGVAEGFLTVGGAEVLVYMQDVYTQWPYEQLGLDDYRAKARVMLERIAARPDRDRFVWVPFNEPDGMWYSDWAADRERFLADWATLVADIRAVLPDARIVGPNEMEFTADRMRDFLEWTAEHDLLPDIVAWHELRPASLESYPAHYGEYRRIESDLGIGPLPINIDEYGNRRDFSVPSRLVQWIAMFEGTKVDADLAYWTYAGNLDDHAVRATEPNGGWWLLKWYAGLGGRTVAVEPGTLGSRAVAAVDVDRAELTILVGGAESDVTMRIEGIDPALFGGEIDVTRTTLGWSGYEGRADEPRPAERIRVPAATALDLVIPAGDPLEAHRFVLTPAEAHPDTELEPPTRFWEAEDARIVGGAVRRHDDDPQKYTASGGRDVAGLDTDDGAVGFEVDVPDAGTWRVGIVYGTEHEIGRHALYLDTAFARELHYPATLDSTYRGRVEVDLELSAGRHLVELRTSGPDGRLPGGPVSLDRLELRPTAPAERIHPIRAARLNGIAHLIPGGVDAPAVARLGAEGAARFHLAADRSDIVELTVVGTEGARCTLVVGDRAVDARVGSPVRIHLGQGVTVIAVRGGAQDLDLVALHVRPSRSAQYPWLAALDLRTVDGAAPEPAGADAAWMGATPVVVPVPAGASGGFDLVLRYGNAAREGGHDYNTDVVSAGLVVRNGDAETTVRLGPTHAWDSFAERTVPVEIVPGRPLLLAAADVAPTLAALRLVPLAP